MKIYIVIEYLTGDWGEIGRQVGKIEATSKEDAKLKWQKLKSISDYEICFYSFNTN